MNTQILLNVPATRRNCRPVNKTSHSIHRQPALPDGRARQLADLAAENGEDAAECASADLFREFPDLKG